jgi:hypothetical protein
VATTRSETTSQEVRNRLLGSPRVDVNEEVERVADTLLAGAADQAGGTAGVGANDAYIAAMVETY